MIFVTTKHIYDAATCKNCSSSSSNNNNSYSRLKTVPFRSHPRIMGPGKAMEVLAMGRRLSAKEAETVGLYTRLYPGEGGMEAAMGELRMLAGLPLRVSQTCNSVNCHLGSEK